jgi:hypothetical protein
LLNSKLIYSHFTVSIAEQNINNVQHAAGFPIDREQKGVASLLRESTLKIGKMTKTGRNNLSHEMHLQHINIGHTNKQKEKEAIFGTCQITIW